MSLYVKVSIQILPIKYEYLICDTDIFKPNRYEDNLNHPTWFLSGESIGLWAEGSWVLFSSRACTLVAGLLPSLHQAHGIQPVDVFLLSEYFSLSPSLLFSLLKNQGKRHILKSILNFSAFLNKDRMAENRLMDRPIDRHFSNVGLSVI